MMMHYQTKFGCKRIRNLEALVGTVIFDYKSPRCDLDLTIFLLDALSRDNTSPYQVWSQKVEQFRRYHQDKIRRHGHSDSNIPCFTSLWEGGGGIKKQQPCKIVIHMDMTRDIKLQITQHYLEDVTDANSATRPLTSSSLSLLPPTPRRFCRVNSKRPSALNLVRIRDSLLHTEH